MRKVIIQEDYPGYIVCFEDPAEPDKDYDKHVAQLDADILNEITSFLG